MVTREERKARALADMGRTSLKARAVGGAVAALAIGLALWQFGSETALTDWLLAGAAGALVSWLLVPGVIYAYNYIRAPLRITTAALGEARVTNRDLAKSVADLQAQIAAVPRPHLRFGDPYVVERALLVEMTNEEWKAHSVSISSSIAIIGPINTEKSAFFAYIPIYNDPPAGQAGDVARKVVATMRFIKEHDPPLELYGRWSETPQVVQAELTREHVAIDLDPNALPHELDVAMKYAHESEAFAFNDENRLHDEELRYERHRLPGSRTLVEVTLRGANISPLSASFDVLSLGIGQRLEVKRRNQDEAP